MRNEPKPRIIIKKRGGGHGHHGGAWKVAYADFVTAMMALFMVLWLLASTDSKARKEISDYFRSGLLPDGDLAMSGVQLKPSIMQETATPPTSKGLGDGAGSGAGGDAVRTAEEVQEAIEKMAAEDPGLAELAAQVTVSVTDEGVLIEAVDKENREGMLFAVASSDLKPGLTSFLAKLGPVLEKSGRQLRINGHTDARQFVAKAGKNNWDLSYERANAARVVLGKHGIGAEQIQSVQAFASSQLRDPARPLAAENRRLSILMLNPPRKPAAAGKGVAPAAGEGAAPAAPAAVESAPPPPAAPAGAAAPAATPDAIEATAGASGVEATPPAAAAEPAATPSPGAGAVGGGSYMFPPIVPPLPPPPAVPSGAMPPDMASREKNRHLNR